MRMEQKPAQGPPERKPGRAFRIYLIVSSTMIVLAAVYSGLVFYSRYEDNLEIQQRAAEKKRADDQRVLEMMGGNTFDILNFYASPGHVHRGDDVHLCYGTSNAKSLSLDPKDANVYPAYSNCVTVTPRKTTTYTLTAADDKGNNKTASVTVEVR
jgi:hypothetical protein